jgi:hypothetical protein
LEKEYVCACSTGTHNYCLHGGGKVKASEAVMDGKKYYHLDCLMTKKAVNDCFNSYMECVGKDSIDCKKICPIVKSILNYLVYHDKIPTEFILKNLKLSKGYYKGKSPQVLYGLRKLFWEKEFQA